MSDFLCLRFKQVDIHEFSPVVWSVLSADGRIHASGNCLLEDVAKQIPESKALRRNILIVPSSAVLLTATNVPIKQHRHLKQVLGFVVEEQIIDPIESMHLATPVYHASETVHIAAVKRELLESWLSALETQKILPDYLFVDVLCVPQKAGDWQLLFEDNKVLFRDADYSGMRLDENTAKSVIQLAISASTPSSLVQADNKDESDNLAAFVDSDNEQTSVDTHSSISLNSIALLLAEADKSLNVSSDSNADSELSAKQDGDSLDGLLDESLDPMHIITPAEFKTELGDFIRSENIDTREVVYTESCSDLLAVNAVHTVETTLNLLQGEFSPISANAANRKFIRKSGAIISACVAVFLVVTMAGGFYLNVKADQYFDDSVTIYRSVFPKQKKVIDPVKQMQRQLAGKTMGGTTSDFLPLLDAASRALSNLETEVPSTIGQLRYDNQRGHIIIDLRVNSIDILESYKEQLTAESLTVDILSANQDQEMVNGRMQISR
ncbi:type II secretion system protein GspL [Pseudomonadales bacterium]|nr:type II secretion system protein GspL [Pseudomonadales bacterium]